MRMFLVFDILFQDIQQKSKLCGPTNMQKHAEKTPKQNKKTGNDNKDLQT